MVKKSASLHDEKRRTRIREIITQASRVAEWDLEEDDETETTESMSFNSSLSPGTQRSVTFNETCIQIEVMPLNEYTAREKKRCWYTEQDKQRIASSKDKAVARLERGKLPSRSSTYRGLECWTTEGGQELDNNIARVVTAVMDEQDRQWALNCDDGDAFARISMSVTAHCITKALLNAAKDEQEAKAVLNEIGQPDDPNSNSISSLTNIGSIQLSPSRGQREFSSKVSSKRKSAHKMPKRKSKLEGVDEKKSSADKKGKQSKSKTKRGKNVKMMERIMEKPSSPHKLSDILLQMHIANGKDNCNSSFALGSKPYAFDNLVAI